MSSDVRVGIEVWFEGSNKIPVGEDECGVGSDREIEPEEALEWLRKKTDSGWFAKKAREHGAKRSKIELYVYAPLRGDCGGYEKRLVQSGWL